MKISYNWLKQYIKIDLAPQRVADILTSIGLEVEAIEHYESIKGSLNNIVVGHVIECIKHPNADKLSLTKVDVGNGTILDIVCGAPNVSKGQKVAVALIGAKIYKGNDTFEIKETTIRGAKSQGMICAEDEIGLGQNHDGILILDESLVPGTPLKNIFPVYEDVVFEIGLTPNRIDAASHYGIARDLAAYLQHENPVILEKPELKELHIDSDTLPIEVIVMQNDACPRYSGVVIKDVEVKESPDWLKNYLLAIGQRPINNVVDVTNFVLHELGHPLHAFDYDKIIGQKVIIRTFPENTAFITLDGIERKLSSEDLMISNAQKPMCIAGIFGGLESGVTLSTRHIFLESAYFNPTWIRKTARRHGLSTDSSFRFERGADVNQTIFSLTRAANLIIEICGGKVASPVFDVYPNKIQPATIELEYLYVDEVIGKCIPKKTVKEILLSLEFTILAEKEKSLLLEVPTYRVDVTRPIDVVEEILRIYGFNEVEISSKISSSINYSDKSNKEQWQNSISDFLVSNGFYEIMTNSLTKKHYYYDNLEYPIHHCVHILNPLSQDLAVLRQNLLYTALEVVAYNLNRQQNEIKLFEFGTCYALPESSKTDKTEYYHEEKKLALIITGNIQPQSWTEAQRKTNFYYLKRWVDSILRRLNIKINAIADVNSMHYQYGINYFHHNTLLATFGKISNTVLHKFDIKQDVFFAELNWEKILTLASQQRIVYSELPKFPAVRRDLAMIVDEAMTYWQLEQIAYKTCGTLLKEVNLFDVYEGETIGKGKKSYALSFILQSNEKTLTDTEINTMMEQLMNAYIKEVNAVIRM
ncbi:MAG: phenylalanine--tRNA ligase subunit beta [Bacteroidales bacterium]|nr:phenylalanine--tRNA ligase subunit beta [Bacteroidales bacterium]